MRLGMFVSVDTLGRLVLPRQRLVEWMSEGPFGDGCFGAVRAEKLWENLESGVRQRYRHKACCIYWWGRYSVSTIDSRMGRF